MMTFHKLEPPRLRLLGRVDDLTIYLVDGELIRNDIDVDFVNGGNGAVYPGYVPLDEVWIDDGQRVLDRTATTLHELIERDLMLHHGRNYDRAHDETNVYESALRRELVRHRPATFDLRRVTEAYRNYLQNAHKTGRELSQDIRRVLGGAAVGARSRT